MSGTADGSFSLSWTRRQAISALGVVTLAIGRFSPTQAATPAEAFVQSTIDKLYAVLNDGRLNAAERQGQYRSLLLSNVDLKRIALFTLGPYARDASEDQIQKFVLAFSDLLSVVCQRALETYRDEAVKVTGSTERSADDVVVSAAITGKDADPAGLEIGFRVRRSANGGFVMTDLQVEGAWVAINQRAEFTAYLAQHNAGGVAQLADELERRTARLRSARGFHEIAYPVR